MTAHELAKLLLELPDIRVMIFDANYGDWVDVEPPHINDNVNPNHSQDKSHRETIIEL